MDGEPKRLPSLKSITHTYIDDQKKNTNHATHPLSSGDISTYQQKSANFIISRNTYIDML